MISSWNSPKPICLQIFANFQGVPRKCPALSPGNWPFPFPTTSILSPGAGFNQVLPKKLHVVPALADHEGLVRDPKWPGRAPQAPGRGSKPVSSPESRSKKKNELCSIFAGRGQPKASFSSPRTRPELLLFPESTKLRFSPLHMSQNLSLAQELAKFDKNGQNDHFDHFWSKWQKYQIWPNDSANPWSGRK